MIAPELISLQMAIDAPLTCHFLQSKISAANLFQNSLHLSFAVCANFMHLRCYIHKASPDACFWLSENLGTFKKVYQEQCKRRCYGCGIHSGGVLWGIFAQARFSGYIYTQRGYLFARLYTMVS